MKTTKLLSVALTAMFVWSGLSAQTKLYEPVVLTIDNENGQYAKGDTVKVYATLSEDNGDQLRIKVLAAGKKISDEPIALKVGEKIIVHEAAWDEPKSVMINVFSESDPKKFTAIGYIVAPEEFTPGYDEPADLMDYWKDQIAKMRKSKAKPKTKPVTDFKGSDKTDCYELEINMPQGNPVRAYVAMPKNAKAASLPIYIYAHAAGVNKKHSCSTPEKAASLAKLGAIAIDINAHGMLNGQDQSYYDDLYRGALSKYNTRELTTRDDYYFRLMYLRLVRALDYLTTLKQWDGKRVLIYGESQGGGQAAALAGIDSRVTAAVLNVPALNDMGAYRQKRVNGWPCRKSYLKGDQKKLASEILPYFDGALLIKYSNAKLFYEAGLVDMTCDPACVFASYNNAGSTDKQIVTYPYRPHSGMAKRYKEDWIEKIDKVRKQFIKNYLKGVAE